MASTAAVEVPTATAEGGSVPSDSFRIVDLRLLSQSELYSLSLCSPSPSFCDDVVVPKIDRSVFNESAGSRKQTYSRLRLAPPSSSASAPRRRTPHLRPTATLSIHSASDPENAENAHIVTLLKQLFMPNMDPGELVPVKIDYSHSLLPQQLLSDVSPIVPMETNYLHSLLPQQVVSNVSGTGQKRKRGRPRKDEGLRREGERDSTVDVSVVDVKNNVTVQLVDEIFVREKVEDMDKPLLNNDGVAVDLVTLGMMEHPFWEEIRRRSEGLKTEEELLGFLKELNGQWGSRRMKRRVVDATDFGNALPVGWKLLLSVKKKSGVVWLNCRRYISPSGQQFISCKEVSSYLLSLNGLQDPNPHAQAQNDVAVKLASVTEMSQPADSATYNEARKETLSPNASSSNPTTKAADSQEAKVRDNLYCKKCNISFSDKVEFLQHQSSLHPKNRSRNSISLADGVIIKDGKYECQFCHKTFNERHRYTGHIGAHVRFRDKMAGELPPIFSNEFPVQDTMIVGSDNVSVSVNNELNFSTPCYKEHGHVGESMEVDMNNIEGVNEAIDVVTAKTPSSIENKDFHEDSDHALVNDSAAEVVDYGTIVKDTGFVTAKTPSAVENKDFHEDSDHALVNDSATEIVDDGSIVQGKFDNCSPLPSDEKTDFVIEISASVEVPKQDMVSEGNLTNSNNSVEAYDTGVNNGDVSQTRDELKPDSQQNFAVNEAAFDFFESRNEQGKDIAVGVNQQSNFDELPSNVDSSSTSKSILSKSSKLNQGFNLSIPHPSNDEISLPKGNVCLSSKSTDETHSFGTHEKRSPEGDYVNDSHKEMQFGISSAIPSWNEEGTQKNSESHHAAENNDDICGRKMEVSEFDGIRNIKNVEMSDPFRANHSALNFNSMSDKDYSREDNSVFGAFNNQKPSAGVLFGQSGVSEVSNAGYSGNEIYHMAVNQSTVNEFENTRNNELSLSCGNNLQKELHTESNMTETFNIQPVVPQNYDDHNVVNTNRPGDFFSFSNLQKGLQTNSNRAAKQEYPRESFNFQPIFPQNFSDQTRSSVVNTNVSVDMKRTRNFGIDFLDSPFNKANEVSSGFNFPPPGGNWSGSSGDRIGNSGQNLMLGFGSSSAQSFGGVMGNWTTGPENVFQNCFNAASSPHVQTSTGFRAFDLTQNKGQEGSSYGINERYNNVSTDTFGLGRSEPVARSEPVEYSFMGEQSSNSMPGDSKIFSYDSSADQGLDPQFWLGKNALMQSIGPSNQVPVACAWCNSVFYQDPIQSGVQTGAIGSICPSCSTNFPGQFNVL